MLAQHSSGSNSYNVNVLPNKSGIALKVKVRSSKHDSFQGSGYLKQQVTVTYRLRVAEVQKRASAEAGQLL